MESVSERNFVRRMVITMAAQGVVVGVLMWYLGRLMNDNKHETFRRRIAGRTVKLNQSEHDLLDCIHAASGITETFDSVGGLSHVKDVIRRSIVLPLQYPDLYPVRSLRSPPKGVLLHGPPGTGKTLVARAIAKCCEATFLEVRVESLFGKWVGQSEQAVAAIFSLARKLQPCLVFVDEIDSLLSSRDFGDNHAYLNAKTIFLRQWDGIGTKEEDYRVVVIGATNRPEVLDPAVLRRLPVKLRLDLPPEKDREAILQILLRDEDVSKLDLAALAARTECFSGSDLRELCKQALLLMVEEKVNVKSTARDSNLPASLTVRMFDRALTVVGANMNAVRLLNEPSHRADNDFSEVLSHVCSDDTSS